MYLRGIPGEISGEMFRRHPETMPDNTVLKKFLEESLGERLVDYLVNS